jgi:hypothetical protein
MFRKVLAALAACTFIVLGGASAASATGVTPLAGEDFGLVCDLNSSFRARTDLDNVYLTQGGSKVDADDIWWRALDHSNNQVSIRVEEVLIQLYDTHAAAWVSWTSKGGSSTDGVTVASSLHWDPSSKFNVNTTYSAIRMKAWYNGSSCTSGSRTT